MASIQITNAPTRISMQNFRSVIDDFGGLVKACRFAVVIHPVGRYVRELSPVVTDLTYLCETTELPGRGLMNMDLRYYGPNFKLPFQTTYEDINMSFLCRTDSLERQFFDDWMLMINPINSWDFNYRDDYYANIDIYQFGEIESDEAQYKFTLNKAYPVLINPQPVTWSDDQIQRLIVSFTYTHWSRQGLDPEQSSTDPRSIDLVIGSENLRNF